QRKMAYLIIALRRRHACFQIRKANPRCRFGDAAHMAQRAARGEEHDAESQQNQRKPQQKKAKAQLVEHAQLIPFGKAEVDMASVGHADRGHAKRNIESRDAQISRPVRRKLRRMDRLEISLTIARAHPKRERSIFCRLEKEDRVAGPASRNRPVRHFARGEFRYLAYNTAVETVLRRSLGNIPQYAKLAGKPCIAAALNI